MERGEDVQRCARMAERAESAQGETGQRRRGEGVSPTLLDRVFISRGGHRALSPTGCHAESSRCARVAQHGQHHRRSIGERRPVLSSGDGGSCRCSLPRRMAHGWIYIFRIETEICKERTLCKQNDDDAIHTTGLYERGYGSDTTQHAAIACNAGNNRSADKQALISLAAMCVPLCCDRSDRAHRWPRNPSFRADAAAPRAAS